MPSSGTARARSSAPSRWSPQPRVRTTERTGKSRCRRWNVGWRIQHATHRLGERARAIRLVEQRYTGLARTARFQELLRIAGREQRLEAGTQDARPPDEFLSIDAVRHDQVGEQEIDLARRLE